MFKKIGQQEEARKPDIQTFADSAKALAFDNLAIHNIIREH